MLLDESILQSFRTASTNSASCPCVAIAIQRWRCLTIEDIIDGAMGSWWIQKVLLQSLKNIKPCSARCRSIGFRTILIALPITLSVRTWELGLEDTLALVKKDNGVMIRCSPRKRSRRTRGQLPSKKHDRRPLPHRAEIDNKAVHRSPCLVLSSWPTGVIVLS